MTNSFIILTCDVCNQPVPTHQDVTLIEALYRSDVTTILEHRPRHLLCDPSRACYIQDQQFQHLAIPTVTNTILNKLIAKRQVDWTHAWLELQVRCGLTTRSAVTLH